MTKQGSLSGLILKRAGGVAGLFLLLGLSNTRAGLYDAYNYHATITFSGYSKAETLTNFPALVVLNAANISGFDYGQFLSGSNDLRFTTADGNTDLNYEIEKWDTSGSSYVWVRVPTIADASASIMAYWGSSGASASPSTTNGATWDANYRGVWHLQTPNATDSTSNRFAGTASGNTNATGKIGTGQGFDGTNNRNIALPTAISTGISGGITVLAWANLHAALAGGTYQGIVTEMYSGDLNVVYEHFADGGKLSAGFYDGTWHQIAEGTALPLDQWCHTASTYDGHYIRVYRNGVQVAISSDFSRNLPTGSNPWEIGHRHDGTDTWNGLIDEARISRNVCSSNWIWAAYMNTASNTPVFQTYGLALSSVGAPSAANTAASNVVSGAAFLNGKVATTGSAPVSAAAVYWGPTDGGTNAALWANTNALAGGPWYKDDVLTQYVSTLTPDQDCFYTYYVSNALGGAIAKPSSYFIEGTVTLSSPDASCGTTPLDTAIVMVSRPASCTGGALTVYYTLSGDATNGVNYTVSPANSNVTLAAGQANATITITPLAPLNQGAPRNFALALAPGPYVVGASNSVTCTLEQMVVLYQSWTYNAAIQFAGYNRAEPLTNFPALVVLSNNCFDGFNYGEFQSGSNDLRLTTADGTLDLNYEIESWNPSGASYVWVQVPQLASNTTIKAWWGKAGQAAAPWTTNGAAWSQNYVGVWHMNQTNAADSTAYRNNGVSVLNTTVPGGYVGAAQGFNGAAGIQCASSASFDGINSGVTLSTWVNPSSIASFPMLFTRGVDKLEMRLENGTGRLSLESPDYLNADTDALAVGNWYYVAATFDDLSNTERVFVNGKQVKVRTDANSAMNHAGNTVYLGRRSDGYNLNGILDEMRVDNVARSTNWIWACYMNMASNRALQSYGSVAANSGAPIVNTTLPTGITATSANLNGYLSSTGSSPATVWVCWGQQNGLAGGAWEFTNQWAEGFWAQGSYPTTNVVNLVADRYYYYAYYASNAGGTSAGGAQAFSTAGITILGTRNGSEVGPTNGLFTISRPDTTTNTDLWVNYTVDGTVANSATLGADYTLSPATSVLIPAGQVSTTITVQVLADGQTEPTEHVKLDLAAGLYAIGTPGSATIDITDQNSSASTALVWWRNRDGTASGTYNNAWWGDVQQAIVNAQGGAAGTGEVRIAGNVTRSSYDVTVSLTVSGAGNVKVSGGWDTAFAVQTNSLRSVLDANSATLTTKGGVMQVSAPNVTLDNLWLKNGQNRAGAGLNADSSATGLVVTDCIISDNNCTGAANGTPGGGVYVNGCNRVKVSRTIIANNRNGTMGSGGGICVNNAGTAADPVILEYCHISGNNGTSYSEGAGPSVAVAGSSRAMIAVSRITAGGQLSQSPGSAIYSTTTDKLTVFGSLIDSNSYGQAYGTDTGLITQRDSQGNPESLVLANCTIADNHIAGEATLPSPVQAVGTGGSGHKYPVLMINTIVGVTDPDSVTFTHSMEVSRLSSSQGYRPHMYLQHCTFSGAPTPPVTNMFYNLERMVAGYVYAGLTNAFARTDTVSSNRFHALDANGAVLSNPGVGSNYDGRIGFVTNDDLTAANPTKRTYKFALQAADPALASGVLKSGAGFKYVDINHDGVFSNTVDVVVAGTPPAGALYVYPYDIKYLGRVTLSGSTLTTETNTVLAVGLDPSGLSFSRPTPPLRSTIDRGAYQAIVFPPYGLTILVR